MKPDSAHGKPAAAKFFVVAAMIIASRVLAFLFGGFMAARYIGSSNWPNPHAPYFTLPLGILIAVAALRIASGNLKGVPAELFILVSSASVAYLGVAARYVLSGYSIQWYPAGLIAAISGAVVISILFAKYRTKLFSPAHDQS